jgi:O-acetyl-ADP-ribose deacetylase (regulator of RNase III)
MTPTAARARPEEVRLGEMFVFDTGSMINPRWIINFPTKGHWKAKSRLEDIVVGLEDLKRVIQELGIRSIAVPPLGCGNGGLDWRDVESVIRGALSDLPDVDVRLFAPGAAPKVDEMRVGTERPNMSRGRALVLRLLGLYGAAEPNGGSEGWGKPSSVFPCSILGKSQPLSVCGAV